MTLQTIFASDLAGNGPTTSAEGRLFMVVQPRAKSDDPQVVEIRDGVAVSYPDARINAGDAAVDARDRFVGVNSLRIGPDGYLWAADRGSTGIGQPIVAHGPKLIRIDIATDRVDRIYDLAAVTGDRSFIDDVRFKGTTAYLTDAGMPGLVVLDLDTGAGRRVLDGDRSVTAIKPLVAEHKRLRDPDGIPIVIHVDQLKVSPDGRWLYYQPCSGGMSRIETRYLDDPTLSPAELAAHVDFFADTPSTGGTAMAADGVIYLSDVDRSRILSITPDGEITTVLGDDRLAWVDAMWIDRDGGLLLPSAQLNRTSGLNGGVDAVVPPMSLYRLDIGAQPLAT